ncbi:MAG: hypothetical protein AAFV88_00655 [Planctomycetota bacterium]
MDAKRSQWLGFAFGLVIASCLSGLNSRGEAAGQNARTQNFLVHAPTQQLADSVANAAERFRDELAEYWLGRKLPPWRTPCPIKVIAGPRLAAQGVTRYDRNSGSNFQMEVIGTPERILDSVLPHEVTHTVLATHFRGPLPRWADEGICTTVEHEAERRKHEIKLREFLGTRRGIAMNRLFLLKEYPADMLPMYAQGYSVCRFLIEQSGPRRFIQFIEGYMQQPSWTENVRRHYGYESLGKLQENWLAWVAAGGGPVDAYVSTRNSTLSRASASVASLPAQSGSRSTPVAPASARTRGPSPQDIVGSAGSGRPPATAGGWYERRIGSSGPAAKQPYQVSQPQPELRYGEPAAPRSRPAAPSGQPPMQLSPPQSRRFY